MTASGDYQRLEPEPEAHGPALDGTQATLMRLRAAAALASDDNAVVRELPINRGMDSSFAHPASNVSMTESALEKKQT